MAPLPKPFWMARRKIFIKSSKTSPKHKEEVDAKSTNTRQSEHTNKF